MSEIRHQIAEIEGPLGRIRLHVAEAGPATGKPVLLLHGFPDFWGGWRGQVEPLSRAGFRVIMPEMRGYGTSDKPRGVSNYSEEWLASDVAGLIRWTGHPRAILVGHDWGGFAAWRTAIRYPELLEKLIILNSPHPAAMKKKLASDPKQVAMSWYMFFFQLPFVPERLLSAGRYRRLIAGLKRSARRGTFTEKIFEELRENWSAPGALTAMVNYYRAAMRSPKKSGGGPRKKISVPTTIIWGIGDKHLSASLAEESATYCESARVERMPEATHWLQYEEPAKVASLILAAANPETSNRA